MVLAVDIGNTNVVIGCFEDEKIIFTERLSTNREATVLEYIVTIKTVLEMNNLMQADFEGAVISSVVPSVTQTVKEAVYRLILHDAMIVDASLKTGLKICLDNPKQLGNDRIADAVAAAEYYPLPLIIVDMGTATTISVIDKNKNFLGGIIMPGLKVSLDSLVNRTSQLPTISLEAPDKVIGTNTIDCMKSGIIYGTASTLSGVISRIEKELGESCTVVSTGGLAHTVVPYCEREIIMDDELLLKGMMLLYKRNK